MVELMVDLVVEGNVYLRTGLKKCCVGIEDGKIVEVKKILKGDEHYDFGDKLVLPGGIDSHVHFREPGNEYKENFETGTISAAFGGITCVLDMPNTIPNVHTKRIFLDKLDEIKNKAFIDFGLFAGARPKTNFHDLSGVATAFKLYMAGTTDAKMLRGQIDEVLPFILSQVSNYNKVLSVHAEDENYINKSLEPKNLEDYLHMRPNDCESSAIERMLVYIRKLSLPSNKKLKVHFCHVSTLEGIGLIRNFRSQFNKKSSSENEDRSSYGSSKIEIENPFTITSEVTPHHLFLNAWCGKGAFCKVNPPLRRTEDQMALWSAVFDGTINTLASDHAPHTKGEKENNEFAYAPSGIPGVETMLPLFLPYVRHSKISIDRFIELTSANPNDIFGLNKGYIEEGKDADLMVVDLRQETQIRSEDLHSKCGWTPYDGMTGIFPKMTIVRGKVVVKDGNLEGDRGWGRLCE
jgi:dihydroorotase